MISIPWDIEAAVNLAQSSIAAGVPFISMDQAPADIKAVTYHVGGDPCADGKLAGEFFVKAAAGKPFKLLELQGGLANDNGIRRSKCLDEAVKAAPNITIVAQVPTDWNPEKALVGTEDEISALRIAIKRIDKAASSGVIHKNQAANRKSRLMRRVNSLHASA